MSQRHKNLLEAFRSPGPAKPPQASVPPPLSAPASPPPKPQSAPKPAPSARPPRAPLAMPDWLARLRSPIAIVLGTQLAIIALAFWLGRWSASLGDPSEARAQEPAESSTFTSSPPPDEPSAAREADEDPPAASRASNPPASAAVAEMTAADRALLERRNLFTIKVAEYRNNDTSRELAMRAYRHLAQHNFPVCTPYLAGSSIYLMVGAAPQAQTMENELLPQIKSLLGPDGKNKDFATAYIVRIDHLVSR